ncbi:hypothetical protein Hypma_014471 [Hypsizygus marmoreus]|uniref:Uncharacterized protein n=1 Tax=Hypsizygus marmoreus TaxID=39966 RepID=A0A369JEP5_HYPMA|nr:hypothetical protein Hypma_014471 [Hypsizygus marmoreus]
MSQLYNDNPIVSHTLAEFTARANKLYVPDGVDDAFIRLALTGEYTDVDDDNKKKQVFLDPIQNIVEPDHSLTISRDYDSVLGIADKLLVDCPISVFSVPHNFFALKTNIHIQHSIVRGDTTTKVDYHRIPNFEFGNFGPRHSLNIFFPGLWSPLRGKSNQPYHLSEKERAFWYENGMRPAIASLLGQSIASEWPATYETERIRAQKSRGGFAWGTKIIGRDVVDQLADRIRTELDENPFVAAHDIAWARNFFILHTIRGVKHSSFHRVDATSAEYYLTEFIQEAHLSYEVPEEGVWFVDVAIEISSDEGACLQWMTSTQHDVVQQALRISDEDAERISEPNSSKCDRDLVSHLTAISGFRITPGVRAQGEFEVAYLQAYTTDKSVLYNADSGHHAKFLTTKEAMGPTQPAKSITGIYTIYEEALKANSSSARLEARVPYQFATKVLLELEHDKLRDCLCSFTRQEWWSFRMTRLMAISQTISLQALGPANMRLAGEALALTAACVWLTNGLHARPDDGPSSRRLMDTVLPITEAEGVTRDVLAYNTAIRGDWEEEEEEEEEEDGGAVSHARVAYNPYGCVFLRRMQIGDVPRLRYGGPALVGLAFKHWFSGMTIKEVELKYTKTGIIDKSAVANIRFTTNKGKMPMYVNWTEAPEPDLFNLRARGHSLPPPAVDDGSDIEDREDPNPDEPKPTIDAFLSQLWRQFTIDLAGKSPNREGSSRASYFRLNVVQRRQGNDDIYKNLTFSEIFTGVAYRNAPASDWQRAFKWLFPPPGSTPTNSAQNYPSCPYYIKWLAFMAENENNPALVKDARDALWKRLRTWSWIPDAQQDKMWPTTGRKGFTRWPPGVKPDGKPEAAARVLLKEHGKPLFPPVEEVVAAPAMEEEED